MDRRHGSKVEQEKVEVLGAQKAANLLFWSFGFSQGHEAFQSFIHLWLHRNYPNYRIGNKQEVYDSAALMAHNKGVVNPGQSHKAIHSLDVHVNIEKQLGHMKEIFEKDLNSNIFSLTGSSIDMKSEVISSNDIGLVPYLTANMIKLDVSNTQGMGRPRSKEIRELTTQKDMPPNVHPYGSHFIDYAILGSDAYLEEFNNMFRQIKTFFANYYHKNTELIDPKYKFLNEVPELIARYNARHIRKITNKDLFIK